MAHVRKNKPKGKKEVAIGRTYYRTGQNHQVFSLSDSNYSGKGEHLGLLESMSYPVTIKMIAKGIDPEITSRIIGKYLADRKSEIRYSRSMGDSEKERLHRQVEDLEAMSGRIASKRSRLVDSYTSFRVSSGHPVKLRESSRSFGSIMKLIGLYLAPIKYISPKKAKKMFSPFESVSEKYPVDTKLLAPLIPLAFTESPPKGGIALGVDDTTEKPVFLDLFGKSSHNVLIFGETGSGKSFFAKLMLMRLAVTKSAESIIIVDPLDEYDCSMFPGYCRETRVTEDLKFTSRPLIGDTGVTDDNGNVTIFKISDLLSFGGEAKVESLLAHIYDLMTFDSSTRKIVLIDEAHLVIGNRKSIEVLSRMVRHSRHYRASIINVTQNVDDLSRNHFSSVIADNSSTIFIFRTRSLNSAARQRFGLANFNDSNPEDLMGGKSAPYSECLAVEGNRMAKVRVLGTDYEFKIIGRKKD